MDIQMIHKYKDFLKAMDQVGFSLLGDNDEGVFSLGQFFSEDIEFHTGDLETDPWTWRIRTLRESRDFTYGKLILKKSAWIKKSWLPYFIAVRRQNRTADELYDDGLMSRMTKAVYDLMRDQGPITPLDLQNIFGKDQKQQITKSLVELQMLVLITMVDETYKLSKDGSPYGWPVAVFDTLESRYGTLETLEPNLAYQKLYSHMKALNPKALDKAINRMIGRMK